MLLTHRSRESSAGLPDGIFSNQKYKFGPILNGLAMEDFGSFIAIFILYCYLVYFAVILYIFPHFGMLQQRKSGNPGLVYDVTRRAYERPVSLIYQGSQIYLGTTYPNGKTIPMSHKTSQMATKYTKWQ
jgi:hypothetical protein